MPVETSVEEGVVGIGAPSDYGTVTIEAIDTRGSVQPRVSQKAGRIQALDGLRAIAIAWVLAFHAQTLPGATWNRWLAAIASRGQFGVEIFFVLSGFLITMLLLREERSRGRIDLRMFYIRRGFRILPPAMMYLLFVCCLSIAGISTASRDLLGAALFFRNFMPHGSADTGHFWTLAIEEQFYLIWPLMLMLLSKRARPVAVVGLTVGLAIFRHEYYRLFPHAQIIPFEFHYEGLLIGSLLALLRDSIRFEAVLSHPMLSGDGIVLAAVAAIAVLLSPVGQRFGKHGELVIPTLLSILVGVVVNAVIHHRPSVASKLLSTKPMVALGLISYSLYLWQQPFCFGDSSLAIALPWCLLIATAAAVTSFLFIERPALTLRQKWFPNQQGFPAGSPGARLIRHV